MDWSTEMINEIKALRQETGESLGWCKKVIQQKYAQKEKQEMENLLWCIDVDNDLRMILEYLIRKS